MKRTRLFIGIAFVFTAILVTYALSSAQGLVGPITFSLEEENDSGETGTVTLTDLGAGKTMVDVTVSGQPAESSQPIQIHEGQCGRTLARIVHPLNNLESGKSSTTIDASLASLTANDTKFAINSHKSEEEYNIYVLCGNIPSLAQVAARETATQQALEALQTRPPGGIPPVMFALMPENESGQSGTVTLTDLGGGRTMVQVNVTGEPAGAIQPLHIHDGQCGPTLARLAYNLQDLVDGKSETTIDASIDSLTTAGFSFAINSHKSQKEYHIYVLCGNIPTLSQGTGALPTAVIAIATTAPGTAPLATAVPAATQALATTTIVSATTQTAATTTTVLSATQTAATTTTVLSATQTAATTTTVLSATQAAATATSVPAATQAPPTATTVPATATTAAAATATRVAPTATSVPATATRVPPTATSAPATATSAPATATSGPATSIPATATSAPPTATSAPATATSVPPTATRLAPTATVAAPTVTQAAPTTASAASQATRAATTTAVQATGVAPTTQAAQETAIAPTTVVAQATGAAPTRAAQATRTATTSAAQATDAAPTTQAAQETATAPTTQAGQETAVAPATSAAQATDVAPTPDAAATATPVPTIPESGGNPYSAPYLVLTMLGILIVAAGLSLMQYSQRGSGGN